MNAEVPICQGGRSSRSAPEPEADAKAVAGDPLSPGAAPRAIDQVPSSPPSMDTLHYRPDVVLSKLATESELRATSGAIGAAIEPGGNHWNVFHFPALTSVVTCDVVSGAEAATN